MTLGAWLADAKARLAATGIEAAGLEASLLAAHSVGQDRTWVLTHPEAPVGVAVEALLERRLAGEPLPYILGSIEFYGRAFQVGPGALIPRPETEHLVEWALEFSGRSTIDIGTGTGCVALTVALEDPSRSVRAVDVSREALAWASTNQQALGTSVELLLGDFASFARPGELFVSNPPYVAQCDPLGPGVFEWEPHLALFGGEDGLGFYRRLASELPAGVLLVEIGLGQGDDLRTIFADWRYLGSRDDLAGIERVLGFESPSTFL